MTHCPFTRNDSAGIWECPVCGSKWPARSDRPPNRQCVSRGLGDTVAKAIHAVTGGLVKPCGGCKKRQEKLNNLLPYRDTADDGRSG